MKNLLLPVFSTVLFATTALSGQAATLSDEQISIQPNGSQKPMQGLEPYFTGEVRVDPLFQPQGEAVGGGATVTFEPGARTNWHTHPVGQTLIVTYGQGWVAQWQGARRTIEPGDVVHIPANVKHWHGATTDTPMVHLAIQEAKDGKVVSWMETVTDEQYTQK